MQSIIVLCTIVFVGCNAADTARRDGELDGTCYPNGTCNAELTCAGTVCVKEVDAAVHPDAVHADAAHADAAIDSAEDAQLGPCSVLAQTGCGPGDACAWIVDLNQGSTYLGHIGCAMFGNRNAGETCIHYGSNGTGSDNCNSGLVCFGGVCRTICGLQSNPPFCTSTLSCHMHDHLLTTANAGVCE